MGCCVLRRAGCLLQGFSTARALSKVYTGVSYRIVAIVYL